MCQIKKKNKAKINIKKSKKRCLKRLVQTSAYLFFMVLSRMYSALSLRLPYSLI